MNSQTSKTANPNRRISSSWLQYPPSDERTCCLFAAPRWITFWVGVEQQLRAPVDGQILAQTAQMDKSSMHLTLSTSHDSTAFSSPLHQQKHTTHTRPCPANLAPALEPSWVKALSDIEKPRWPAISTILGKGTVVLTDSTTALCKFWKWTFQKLCFSSTIFAVRGTCIQTPAEVVQTAMPFRGPSPEMPWELSALRILLSRWCPPVVGSWTHLKSSKYIYHNLQITYL